MGTELMFTPAEITWDELTRYFKLKTQKEKSSLSRDPGEGWCSMMMDFTCLYFHDATVFFCVFHSVVTVSLSLIITVQRD